MKDTKRITEGALMTGIYLLMLMVIIFTPGIIGAVLLFTLPVPFIFYSYRHGWRSGILMLIASMIFTTLFATIFSLPVTLLVGVGGLFVGAAMYEKRSPYETWAMGSIGFIIGVVSVYVITQLFFGINWAEEIRTSLNGAFSMTEGMLQSMVDGENAEEQLSALREQLQSLPDLIPSILAIVGISFALISQWVSYKVINRFEKKELKFPSFRDLKFPTSVLWYYFFGLIINYMLMEQGGIFYLAAVNVFTLTGVLIVIQGFSFMFYYAHVKKWPKAVPVVGIIVSLLLPQILLYLIRILGIIDIGFPLRQRLQEKKKP